MKCMAMVVLLLFVPLASALSPKEAVTIGKSFVLQHATVGYRGISVNDYSIATLKVYQNPSAYRVIYELSSEELKKSRFLMVQIAKENGMIERVWVGTKEQMQSTMAA